MVPLLLVFALVSTFMPDCADTFSNLLPPYHPAYITTQIPRRMNWATGTFRPNYRATWWPTFAPRLRYNSRAHPAPFTRTPHIPPRAPWEQYRAGWTNTPPHRPTRAPWNRYNKAARPWHLPCPWDGEC